jgi:phosphoenolpyruvate synthase/pyruvate phosphate dikinase
LSLRRDKFTDEIYLVTNDNQTVVRKGEYITVDGTHGVIYRGKIPLSPTGRDSSFLQVIAWSEKYKRMNICSLVYDELSAQKSVLYGADNECYCNAIGMFNTQYKRDCLTALLLCSGADDRKKILEKIYKFLLEEYISIFKSLPNFHVRIALIDPRIEDFLPSTAFKSLFQRETGIRSPYSSGTTRTLPEMETYEVFEKDIISVARQFDLNPIHCVSIAKSIVRDNVAPACLSQGNCFIWSIYPDVAEMQVKAIAS